VSLSQGTGLMRELSEKFLLGFGLKKFRAYIVVGEPPTGRG